MSRYCTSFTQEAVKGGCRERTGCGVIVGVHRAGHIGCPIFNTIKLQRVRICISCNKQTIPTIQHKSHRSSHLFLFDARYILSLECSNIQCARKTLSRSKSIYQGINTMPVRTSNSGRMFDVPDTQGFLCTNIFDAYSRI
jgi:hypothetical protein